MTAGDFYGPAMADLLALSEQALIDDERPASLVTLAPGAHVAWDCGDSELYVRALPFQPHTSKQNACSIDLIPISVAVGVLRCVGVLDDDGAPPTPTRMTADTLAIMSDMNTLMHVLDNITLKHVQKVAVRQWQPLGPQGGIAGGEWTLDLTFLMCR